MRIINTSNNRTFDGWHLGIVCTVFGGWDDNEDNHQSAYGLGYVGDKLGVSLPYRFKGKRPKADLRNPANGKVVIGVDVLEVGPWNINDPWFTEEGRRPQAESGYDLGQTRQGVRKTNRAGIDLTPPTALALGIKGKGVIDVRIYYEEE